ncbi:hypothetical protein AMD24_00105 [Candidatus Xiphinematobacter sp. Idaho Grape]|uniref:hypothetical protein n=1 Tax=Candidatus Xiphinematobacter sp. Idaho Grape TaxID=1704307 RepID=UPI000706283D|nr:hypothetical protein [Candidatus Xiphinematobacter sp. Idaho Grape]ALJ56300.1 hypothetical protein AMD24_00105 [Candidatus Xiphinematobacter sp. Idaho Grape]
MSVWAVSRSNRLLQNFRLGGEGLILAMYEYLEVTLSTTFRFLEGQTDSHPLHP